MSAAIDAWKTSETEMSRALYQTLVPGDVAMADQLHGRYVDLALIQQQGADGLIRKHHARKTDFRTGKKNGIGDHQVQWSKPQQRPRQMSPEAFDALPPTMIVREVSLRLTRQGWRDQYIIVNKNDVLSLNLLESDISCLVWRKVVLQTHHLKTICFGGFS